jgi:hypothetical protein
MSSELLSQLNADPLVLNPTIDEMTVAINTNIKNLIRRNRGRPKKTSSGSSSNDEKLLANPSNKPTKAKKQKIECPACLELKKTLNEQGHKYTVLISRLKQIVDLN